MSAQGIIKGPTSIRKDPACGTCRKKCRKCDRTRPVCKRCVEKGLHCEGYPPRFTFWDGSGSGSGSGGVSGTSPGPNNSSSNSLAAAAAAMAAPGAAAAQGLETISVSTNDSPETTGTGGAHTGDDASPDTYTSPSSSSMRAASFAETPPAPAGFGERSSSAPAPSYLTAAAGGASASSQLPDPAPKRIRDLTPVEDVLAGNEWLLQHFESDVADTLAIAIDGVENPFRQHVVTLAHRHGGVFHALFGLASCHMCESHLITGKPIMAVALEHRVSALSSLGSLLLKEEVAGLDTFEEECVLAIVLLLVLHDIGETGISSEGAHLTGISFLCDRIARTTDLSHPSKAGVLFFIATLSWLDVLRGFSGAEKLAYSEVVRACVRDNWSFGQYMTIGCPPNIFYCIGSVLEEAKAHKAGLRSLRSFQRSLDDAEAYLRNWNPDENVYPTNDDGWKQLAEAYRHACLLRIMRWPNTFGRSCEDEPIRASVSAILDVCATMQADSPFYKRLLFPLFLAGAETSSPHQMQYVRMSIDKIKQSTGCQHHGMTDVLQKVWEERRTNVKGWTNVPWMEYTCFPELEGRQHAYLFF